MTILSSTSKSLRRLFAVCVSIIALGVAAQACDPWVPRICEAYSESEAVFVGTLLKTDKVPNNYFDIDAQFAVKRIYKGSPQRVETVRFDVGDCGNKQITEIGKDYFVYKYPLDRRFRFVANLSSIIGLASEHLKYGESLSPAKPIFTISGRIAYLTAAELQQVSVSIQHDKTIQRLKLDEYGRFTFTTTKDATYEVKLTLPFEASLWTEVGRSWAPPSDPSTTHTYSLPFRPNDCDFREINVHKTEKKPIPIDTKQ